MPSSRYVIRGGAEGRERLRLLSSVMGPGTCGLLDRVGVPVGGACLELGCGGGDVAVELARRVGPTGRVVGVDLDATKVALARAEAGERGLANLELIVGDVTAGLPTGPFDVAYARFLLSHLADPAALLAAVRRRVRPGGVVVVEDVDFRGHFAEPPSPALDRYVELYRACVAARGGNADIGLRLPGLLCDAGLAEVRLDVLHPVDLTGGIKLLSLVTFEAIADTVVDEGLASAAEVQAATAALRLVVDDPTVVLGGPRVVQTWGRVPGAD